MGGVCSSYDAFRVLLGKPDGRRTLKTSSSVADRREGGWGVQPPSPEIPKALQKRAKLNPIVKTVKNV